MDFIHERLAVVGGLFRTLSRSGEPTAPTDWRWSDEDAMTVKHQTFNLRLWFAACSFGTIAVICGLGALWVSNFLTTSLLERESEVSQEFLETIVAVDGPAMFHDDGAEPYEAKPELLDFAQ